MSEQTTSKIDKRIPSLIIFVMLLTLFFLSYLALTSQLIIFHDSIGYQNLAEMFTRGQWKEYFTTGPSREPLYSLVIALAMRIAQWQNLDYLAVQVMIQVTILILSQFLTYKLLKKMQISDGICALTLAYMGFSPALTSSGLILFSEIITYPIVLWLILSLSQAWSALKIVSLKQNITNAFQFAVPALLITLTKASFELIIPIVLTPFLWITYQSLRKGNKKIAVNALIFIVTVFCFLELPIVAYKLVNQHYNGVYALTDRGPEALYGNTARRMQPISKERIQTALAYMAGPDVCSKLYGERCLPWAFLASDILGNDKIKSLRSQGLTRPQINDLCIKESMTSVLENPIQYFLLSLIESFKILFWEVPEISYVVYPDAIDKIYNGLWLRYPLRFAMALVSGWVVLLGVAQAWTNRKRFFDPDQDFDERTSLHFFLLLIIIVFTGLHSIFLILPRYALPVAPLFLALIAWQFDIIAKKKRART